MITLDTFAALHEHQHTLAAYCPLCRRWGIVDLAGLIAQGRGGESAIGRKPRCRGCGELGQFQLRPPMNPGGGAYPRPVSG